MREKKARKSKLNIECFMRQAGLSHHKNMYKISKIRSLPASKHVSWGNKKQAFLYYLVFRYCDSCSVTEQLPLEHDVSSTIVYTTPTVVCFVLLCSSAHSVKDHSGNMQHSKTSQGRTNTKR